MVMIMWAFAPAVLVTGNRVRSDPVSQDNRELFAVQEVAASVVHAATETSTEVCFQTNILLNHWGNTSGDRQLQGDIECVQSDNESLKSLAVGDGVWLRQSNELVTHVTTRHGFSEKIVNMERALTVLGVVASRTVNVVQKIIASHHGSKKKTEGAQMLVVGMDWPLSKHACFKAIKTLSRATVPMDGISAEEMPQVKQNSIFCLRLGDQSSSTQESISRLQPGNDVTMTVVHEIVRYTMNGGGDQLSWDLYVSMQEGSQTKAHWISYATPRVKTADARFQGAGPDSDDGGKMKFCFTFLDGGEKLCFEKDLQDASTQVALLNLETESLLELSWEDEWVTYVDDPSSTSEATRKNMITNMNIAIKY